jgi:hypothetical protein
MGEKSEFLYFRSANEWIAIVLAEASSGFDGS